jgi:hypothetical protein
VAVLVHKTQHTKIHVTQNNTPRSNKAQPTKIHKQYRTFYTQEIQRKKKKGCSSFRNAGEILQDYIIGLFTCVSAFFCLPWWHACKPSHDVGFFYTVSSAFFLAPPISNTEMFIRVTDHQRRRFVCLYLLNRPRLMLFVAADHGIIAVTAAGKNRAFTSQKMQLDTSMFHFRFT